VKDDNGNYVLSSDSNNSVDDALGGNAYYLARAELHIPLGSGAAEMGLKPSIYINAGSVFDLTKPTLSDTGPKSVFIPATNSSGQALYTQITAATLGSDGTCTTTASTTVTNAINPNPPACLTTNANTALGTTYPAFREVYLGDSAKPRVSVGFGINWNSPFGPFRIDIAKAIVTQPGDDKKLITFNVGTQF